MGKIIGAVFALIVVILLGVLWGVQILKGIFLGLLMPAGPVLILLLVAVVAVIIGLLAEKPILFAVTTVATLGAIFCMIVLPYAAAHNYAGSVKEVTASAPEYAQRAPFAVAVQSSERNLQNTTGEAQATKSLAAEGKTGQWNTLVIRRGVFVGYESVQSINTPLYGTVSASEVTLCNFSSSVSLRLNGSMPSNNLDRAILTATPANVSFEEGDVYSYCKGKTPMVVVPLRELNGFWGPTWSAYGVATLNGKTGEVSILTSTKDISEIPGPVYPISLAKDTRNAYQSSQGFWDAVQGRTGYEATNRDTNDPNEGNNSEFSLKVSGTNDVNYVTPLTPRGSSTSIVAESSVDANKVVSGTRNVLTINKFTNAKSRSANSSVANAIKTQYSWMPDWASGIGIFEIVPADNGTWVASIGQSQSVVYRAVITTDNKVTLFNAKGDIITRSTPGGASPSAGGDAVPANADLAKLTPAQLQELANAIIKELGSRAATTK